MSNLKEQQNILDNLRVPIKSFRIFALEEVIRTGNSSEILHVLEEISLFEDDPECKLLISHAILAVKERMAGSQKVQGEVVDSATFLTNWAGSDDNMRMHTLSNLPARLPKDIRALGPNLLEKSSPVVAARVIRAFGRNWPEDKLSLISEKLHSESLILKLAALRTMVHVNPEQLLPDLPVLLASNDPEIKALAIRGLTKIDKEEALNHLQALLLSPTKTERLAGIQNCTFLPFDMVKPLLLKYFAAEVDSELLTKAGWIIEMNPDVEVPFNLFEIAERSPAKKAQLVRQVLNDAVKLLEKSGILGDKFAAYTKKLQSWVNKRNALRYVKQIVARLDTNKVAPEIDNNITVAIKQPIVVEAFKEALSWPISEVVKSRISAYLGISDTKSEVKEKYEPSEKQASSHGGLSQLEAFASMTPEKGRERFNQILLVLNHGSSSIELKIAAFNCLTRCRLEGAENIAVKYIRYHDVSLATAAVEYLGIVNPDQVFPYLGHCLKIADVGMKSTALGILKNFDYNQAISSLRTMLYSTDSTQQSMAMECMNQFDFALVRDMLTEFLCLDYPVPLLEAGLLHFAANPSSDNVYSLYKIEQAHKGKIAEQAKKLREASPVPTEEMVATPSDSSDITEEAKLGKNIDAEVEKDKKEAELKERLRAEQEKKKSRKAYAYISPSENVRTSKQQLIEIKDLVINFVKSRQLPLSIAVFVFVAIFFYVLFVPSGSKEKSRATGSAVVAVKETIEGQVNKIIDGVVYLKAADDRIFILNPRSDGFNTPPIGSLLRISILPYRITTDGENVAKIRAMRIIKKYSEEFGREKAK